MSVKSKDNGLATRSVPRKPRRARPGLRTSELWGSVAAMAAAMIAGMESDDRHVKIAALGAFAMLGTVLGGLYIWSRTRVKTDSRWRET